MPRSKLECSHYWIIEAPKGPTSMGRCKYCGTVSEFSNYVPFPSWENRPARYNNHKDLTIIESEEDVEP
ncbi:MAG: hypothetical protein FJ004_09615 [Chloroflexi bacterium]|nr:hypothetical protein [Chloroflexota bacterium]